MTKEELLALGITPEQANEIFAMRGTEVNALRNQITALTQANASNEEELNALRQQSMTAEQLQQQAIDLANEEKAKWQKANNQLVATTIFTQAGMSEEEYSSFINGVVSTDEETTKTLASSIANAFKTKLDAKEAELQEALLKNTTPPEGSDGSSAEKITEQEKIATQLAQESVQSTGFSAYLKGE